MRDKRSILVTGGSGFIGSALIRQLLTAPCTLCLNLDLLTYASQPLALKEVENDPRYIFVEGDIGDRSLVASLCDRYEIDAILHLAAESHVDRSIEGPGAFIQTNIVGSYSLLEVVRQRPHIHFHHVSTDEVYGSLARGHFSEESPYDPRSPYSASKAASDHLVKAYGNTYGISYTLSHCGNNYGPYQHSEKLIPLAITRLARGEPFPLYGDGAQVRDWIHVDDHVSAILQILAYAPSGANYLIGAREEWRNRDLLALLIEILAQEGVASESSLYSLIQPVRDRPGHDRRYAIDPSKIERELGWRPRRPLREALRETALHYLQQLEEPLKMIESCV